MYAQKLEGDEWLGEKMDMEKVEKMSGMSRLSHVDFGWTLMAYLADQQLGQMYELMQAIRKQELEENDLESSVPLPEESK